MSRTNSAKPPSCSAVFVRHACAQSAQAPRVMRSALGFGPGLGFVFAMNLMASPKALRPLASLPRTVGYSSLRKCNPLPLQRSASMLGVDVGLGLGVGALGALRVLTGSVSPKRVRVVTDIDDTVKSSGNKRLFGVPLGGIDAQCEAHPTARFHVFLNYKQQLRLQCVS